jgi:hypothetical protein
MASRCHRRDGESWLHPSHPMKSLLSSFFRRANTPPPIPDERSEHFTNVMLPAMDADRELRNEYGPFDE